MEASIVRTDERCTNCSKVFIAKIDMRLDGNHTIICPYCAHHHLRVIKAGKVTGDRWGGDINTYEVSTERMWSDKTIGAKTTTAAEHIRQRFLLRSEEVP